MRKSEEIRADIEKLTKELEVVKIHEAKQSAAVHILYNLGWKHDPRKGWQKPEPKRDWKEFDKDTMSPYKVGDLVYSMGAYYMVTRIVGGELYGQRIKGANAYGYSVWPQVVRIPLSSLSRAVSKQEVYKHYNQ